MHIVPLVKYLSSGISLSSFVFVFWVMLTSFLTILFIKSAPPAFKNSSKFLGLINKEFNIFNPFNFNNLLAGSFISATAFSSAIILARPPFLMIDSANFGFLKAK